jgi:beta-carotene 3-hydroxylase
MVHKRFPTGPLGQLPFLKQIAAGHSIHHTEAFDGVPWGLFMAGAYTRSLRSST